MKIFISEYIILYETFYLNIYEEYQINSMFFDYVNYFESLCHLNNRFVFKITSYYHDMGIKKYIYLKKKQWAYDFFWKRKLLRRTIFFKLIPLHYLPRKWMKGYYSYWWHIKPNCYKFHQYGYFNELVMNFYVNHEEMIAFRSEYPKYDCCLIFNHANEQFDRKVAWIFERKRKGWVFFRPQPYRLELLLYNLRWIPGATKLLWLNPNCGYFGSGSFITYARKWVYWTYHIYNGDRPRPFVVYGYWTSDFFFDIFKYKVVHYRNEFFRDSIAILGPIIGTTEVIQMYLYFFLRVFMYCMFIFWFTIFFAFFYSREKMVKLLILDSHLGNFTWFYSLLLNNISLVQNIVRVKRVKKLKKYGIKLERKSQLESKMFKLIKRYMYIPFMEYYLKNIVNTKNYINRVEGNFLGPISSYDTFKSYVYLLLIIINMPFRFFSTFKTAFYRFHTNYYLKWNHIFKHSKLYNAKSNYSFNRFFSTKIVHEREIEGLNAYDVLEKIINYIDIYMKKEFLDVAKQHLDYVYKKRLNLPNGETKREEIWNYYYYRTFGNYDPEREFYHIARARFFTRIWYYGTDFSFNLLNTHQLYVFFNYVHSPLFIKMNITSNLNFYYLLFTSKGFYYYYYYGYYFFIKKTNIFYFYLNYFFLLQFYLFRQLKNLIDVFFDGRSWVFIKYFWKMYLNIFYLWLRKEYFFIKYIEYFIFIVYFLVHFFFKIVFVNIKLLFFFIWNSLINFFSFFVDSDFGRGYSFWHRYYMLKFYFIEYNIFYSIFIFIKNFFFNFFLIFLIFFVLTSIPFLQELIFSDYLIHKIYLFINVVFEYNKFIYFNEVLDNWWVPYFSPEKFINFYKGYCNYFDVRMKRLITRSFLDAAHLGIRRYPYNQFFFDHYLRRRLYYLKWVKYNDIYLMFRRIFPGTFPWELYFYMHGYFILVNHPARHFMPDIYWNTLPILWTFIWRYKYYLFIYKIFVPLYWFWKYSFNYLIFSFLVYFKDTIFFSIVFNFFYFIYKIYYKINYNLFYFCYYYYFYFLFTVSKLMRYYFITYDVLNHIWVYRSARFIALIDLFNFFRFFLDSFYFFITEFFYGFFYFFYKITHFMLDCLGLISFYNYSLFSLNFLPKFHSFISEWFNYFIALNYELDEYGRILAKNFRGKTRFRTGDWIKRDMAVRSVMKFLHRTTSFEFKFREFLFYMKKDLMKNFLVYNKIKLNNFNLFFFSFFSLYLNYLLLLFIFSLFSLKLRNFFKNDVILSSSPFFEWERFSKKNRHLIRRDEFYWLYNIRWLRRFEFYIDKHFSDDLYLRTFNENEVRFGYYLYNQWSKFFVYNEKNLRATMFHNKFLLYKKYYMERYFSIIKDIDFIFHEYSIRNKKVQYNVYSFYDFFIPKYKKNLDFDFKKDFVQGYGNMDNFWFYFATPQLMYSRNWNFMRVITREKESIDFYNKVKKSLFKAYALYEMNREEIFYDFFEFQFFEPEFYDDVLYENVSSRHTAERNYFLHRIALSRWNSELVYCDPSFSLKSLYWHMGYDDWVGSLENHYYNLRNLNLNYFNNFIDFGIFSFINPVHKIYTHIDAEIVKDSVDLSTNDNVIGIKYSELYQYEDLGKFATEQHLFELIDDAFRQEGNGELNVVSLTEDSTLSYKHANIWTILTIFLPMIIICVFFEEYIYFHRHVAPHITIRDILATILPRILSPLDSDIILFHKLLTMEHMENYYWYNPWTYIRTHVFDLYRIDNYSFWEGKHAKFLQSKREFAWIFTLIVHEDYRYDNISFLCWNFYVESWKKCWESVVIFIIFEIFMYFLLILFFLFIFNFYLLFRDYYRYLSKEPLLRVTEDDTIEFRNYEEKMKQKREHKKKNLFNFVDFEVYDKYKKKVKKYKTDTQRKKI